MLQNTFVKILIALIFITSVFILWQLFTDPFEGSEDVVRERSVPYENYEFLTTPLFDNLNSFHGITPVEGDSLGRENPFNVY